MPLWSFSSGGVPGASGKTLDVAKRQVARVVGAADKPDEVGATEAIEAAIDEMNRVRWESHTVRGSDITIVDGTGLALPAEGAEGFYTLPQPFKAPLSLTLAGALVGGDTRTLSYIPRATWDGIRSGTSLGGTYFYTNFNLGLSGKVQLLDMPTAAGTMEIRYYRPIAVPQQGTDILDVLAGPQQQALLAKATFYVALWRGLRSERVAQLDGVAQRLLKMAMGDDVSQESVVQTIPYEVWARRTTNLNSTWPYIDGGSWW